MTLKVYGVNVNYGPPHKNGTNQRRAIVAAPTKKAAAEAFGVSQYFLGEYGGETGNDVEVGLALQHPGKVLVHMADASTPSSIGDWVMMGTGILVCRDGAPPVWFDDDFAAAVSTEEWKGLRRGDLVKIQGSTHPRTKYVFIRYFKSATQEYVEVQDQRTRHMKPVAPSRVIVP